MVSQYNSHPTLTPVISKHNWSGFLQEKALKTQDLENLNLMFFIPSNSPLLQHLILSSASVPMDGPVVSLAVWDKEAQVGLA